MSKHTPGSWKVEKELTSRTGEWLIAKDAGDCGRGIAIAETVPATGKELANARLIAAAPDLLEALQAMLEVHGVNQAYADKHIEIPQSWVDLSDIARAAIAKATGEQQ